MSGQDDSKSKAAHDVMHLLRLVSLLHGIQSSRTDLDIIGWRSAHGVYRRCTEEIDDVSGILLLVCFG